MAAEPVLTAEELVERVRNAAPPTPDDVTILWDGRRLDSREAVMEWVAEIESLRAQEAAAAAALNELNARLRVGEMTDAEARTLPIQIDSTTLDKAGMSTWMTDAGPFDVRAGLEAANGHLVPYEELSE